MTTPLKAPVERLSYTVLEAAAAVGVGETTFRTEFLPHLRVVRVKSKVLVPVDEIRRFLVEQSEEPLRDQLAKS